MQEAVLSAVEAMLMKLYGSQTNSESAPLDDATSPGSRNPSLQAAVVEENGGPDPAMESVTTQQKTTLTEASTCCAGVPPPGRPDLSSTMSSEPASESTLNHSANTSSSSSLEDWVLNKSLCELDANLPLVNEDVLFTCAGLTDQASPAGPGSLEEPGSGAAGISAESWSTGRAFRDLDTGEPLEPVKIHQSAEPFGETKMESRKSPCEKTLSNAVTEKMTKLTAYDLISSRAVRQPMSASAIFQQEVRPTILLENPKASLKEVTLAMEEQWKNLKEEDRQK